MLVLSLFLLVIAIDAALVPTLETHHISFYMTSTASKKYEGILDGNGGAYIVPHFAYLSVPDGGYVTICSEDDSHATNYTGNRNNFDASYIHGPRAIVSYTPPTNTRGLNGLNAFLIDRLTTSYKIADPETVCGQDNSEAAVCFQQNDPIKYQKAQAIARLFITSSSWCTGWLFGSEGHLITNNHCVRNNFSASAIQVEFGAECKTCRSSGSCKGRVVATNAELVYTNMTLDFSLLKLNLIDGASIEPYGFLQARESGPTLNEEIYIPQHPSGNPTRIAVQTDGGTPGTISTMSWNSGCTKDSTGYQLDTQGGSSGSPVLSALDNSVIALHNCGGCMDSRPNSVNGGIKIDKIVRQLKSLDLLPKDALVDPIRTVTPSPFPTHSPSPTTSQSSRPTPFPSTNIPATTTTPPQITTTQPPSTTFAPTIGPFTPSPTTSPPGKVCRSCKGCYFPEVKWCMSVDVSQSDCERSSGMWCSRKFVVL